MSVITAFGIRPNSAEWGWGNDGVLSTQWTEESDLVRCYFKFAVVRNPWDRFVSGWKYLPSTRRRSLLDVLRNLPPEGHDFRHLTRPQYITLFNSNGTLAVNQLLRFENLEEDFRDVCRRVQINPALPRLNVTRRAPYRHFFNRRSRLLFEELFIEDIRRFGYQY